MGNELTYFKFVCELIDAGIWAKMSPAARTLYPVLLRFSDRNFSPVYPGSKKLMELTGFKQKSSLRKARNELVELGLISITLGNGRKNTIYHFRFDWITPRGTQKYPSESRNPTTTEGSNSTPVGDTGVAAPGYSPIPPYNQIQISINNHPVPSTNSNHQEMQKDPFEELKKQFG
ncbi:MAG: helix-turn-helix domain-containing protein, partial [Leptonema sp. (in: bacteria)]